MIKVRNDFRDFMVLDTKDWRRKKTILV